MKNILFLVMILICPFLFGQNEDFIKTKNDFFNRAEKAHRNSDGLAALHYYHCVYALAHINTNSNSNSNPKIVLSKKRIDSLFPIFQKMEIKKWKGTWILKQLRTDLFDYQKIVITNKEIIFYDKENDTIPSHIEKIRPAEYNPNDVVINISRVEFQNGKIWEFSVEKSHDETRLFPKRSDQPLLYPISIIRDSIERKKTLAKELRTYYVLEE